MEADPRQYEMFRRKAGHAADRAVSLADPEVRSARFVAGIADSGPATMAANRLGAGYEIALSPAPRNPADWH